MKITNKQILCIGEVLWDKLPTGVKPGGAPLNVAVHLKAIGNEVKVASSIGKDKEGKELKAFLEKSGLNTELIQEDKSLPTSEVLVYLDNNKNATFEICEPVAWDNIQLSQSLHSRAKESGITVYGSIASRK